MICPCCSSRTDLDERIRLLVSASPAVYRASLVHSAQAPAVYVVSVAVSSGLSSLLSMADVGWLSTEVSSIFVADLSQTGPKLFSQRWKIPHVQPD